MDSFNDASNLIQDKIGGWAESAVTFIPNLVVATLIFGAFILAAIIVRKIVRKAVTRVTKNRELRALTAKISFLLIIGIGIFVSLGVLELDKALTSLLAGAGVIGLALGFAFQDITANFISGVSLSLKRPFEVGDLIETNGQIGKVREISLRSTLINSADGQIVSIPNKDVFQNVLTNYSRRNMRRVQVAVGVAYDSDLEKVEKVAKEAVKKFHTSKDQAIQVFYDEFAGSSINLNIYFWISLQEELGYFTAKSEGIKAVKEAFVKNNIEIPFPIRTLDLPKEMLKNEN
jgi:small conductance mechanosensitive channel